MGAQEPRSENLEGRGTGVTDFYLLGDYCQGHTMALVLCSKIQVCFSDLGWWRYWGRDGLLVLVRWGDSVLLIGGGSRSGNLEGKGTGGRGGLLVGVYSI